MLKLSRMDFHVLNAVAAGSVPFSMIYQDPIFQEQSVGDFCSIVHTVFHLISAGLLELCEIEVENGERLTSEMLLQHYQNLDRELREVGRPFYYGKGEYFLQMTEQGRSEWDSAKYQPYYEDKLS
jgi:hypothetical protein